MLPLAAAALSICRFDLVAELNKESDLLKSVIQLIAIAVGVGLMLLVAMLESR